MEEVFFGGEDSTEHEPNLNGGIKNRRIGNQNGPPLTRGIPIMIPRKSSAP